MDGGRRPTWPKQRCDASKREWISTTPSTSRIHRISPRSCAVWANSNARSRSFRKSRMGGIALSRAERSLRAGLLGHARSLESDSPPCGFPSRSRDAERPAGIRKEDLAPDWLRVGTDIVGKPCADVQRHVLAGRPDRPRDPQPDYVGPGSGRCISRSPGATPGPRILR